MDRCPGAARTCLTPPGSARSVDCSGAGCSGNREAAGDTRLLVRDSDKPSDDAVNSHHDVPADLCGGSPECRFGVSEGAQ